VNEELKGDLERALRGEAQGVEFDWDKDYSPVIEWEELPKDVQEYLNSALESPTVSRPRRKRLTEPVDPDSLDS
jgi:hypothetical protein